MVALEMSRILQNDKSLHVVGLLWMDTICPWSTVGRLMSVARPRYRAGTQPEMKVKIDACFDDAWRMIGSWSVLEPYEAPPVILIRARQTICVSDRFLGWESCGFLNFVDVLDADGDHFSMFDPSRVCSISLVPTNRKSCFAN